MATCVHIHIHCHMHGHVLTRTAPGDPAMRRRGTTTAEDAILDEGPPYDMLREAGCRHARMTSSHRDRGHVDVSVPRSCDIKHCRTLDDLIIALTRNAVPISDFACPKRLLHLACLKRDAEQRKQLVKAGLSVCPSCDHVVFPQFEHNCSDGCSRGDVVRTQTRRQH